jgi:type IV pilus assembly protein PilA
MRIKCDKKGFSLIEMIVVCVIVAILAAVSVPLYLGYINNQRWSTVNNLAQTGAAAANAYVRRTGADPTLAQLNLFYDSTSYTVAVDQANDKVTVTDKSKTSITKSVGY